MIGYIEEGENKMEKVKTKESNVNFCLYGFNTLGELIDFLMRC